MNVHEAIRKFKLNTTKNGERFYGTCDRIPNASEIVLSGLLSAYNSDINKNKVIFFTYDAGPSWYTDQTFEESKNGLSCIEPLSISKSLRKIEKWIKCKFNICVLEDVIETTITMNLTINKLIELISAYRTYRSQYKVCHIPKIL